VGRPALLELNVFYPRPLDKDGPKRDLKEKRLTSCFAWQYLDLVIGYRPALAAAVAD
jgi:hypothetical protein